MDTGRLFWDLVLYRQGAINYIRLFLALSGLLRLSTFKVVIGHISADASLFLDLNDVLVVNDSV